jgi:purine-nucleoside phosphorylase
VLALSVVTDACDPDHLHPVDVPTILAVAARVAPTLTRLISEVVRRLDSIS